MLPNAPLAFVDQYIGNLKQYRAIAIDVGDQDGLRVDAGKLHNILDSYRRREYFEIYSGTHTSAVADSSRTTLCRSSARTSASLRIAH